MELVITTAGLAALDAADIGGLQIIIPEFRVGSAYDYEPEVSDIDLHGTTLHTGSTSNFHVDALGQIHYTCWMNETVGPFMYGELGLYLDDGTLFALASLDEVQVKAATTESSRGNIISLDVVIDIENGQALITTVINEIAEAKLLAIAAVAQLLPPITSPTNAYLVEETDDHGNNMLAYRASDTQWNFNTHGYFAVGDGVATALDSTTLTSTQLTTLDAGVFPRGRYIVVFVSGNFAGEARVVETIDAGTGVAEWAEPFVGSGDVGDMFVLLQSTMSYCEMLASQIPAHTHAIADVVNLQDELDAINALFANYALTSHSHTIADVTGLQDALDALALTLTAGVPTDDAPRQTYGFLNLPGFQIRFGKYMFTTPGGSWGELVGPFVTFKDAAGGNKPFGTACACVVAVPICEVDSNGYDGFIQMHNWSQTGWTPRFNSGEADSSSVRGFMWIAIGV
jgi:hypothetical protein